MKTDYWVGDTYIENNNGKVYTLTAIGTGERSGQKQLTFYVRHNAFSEWMPDEMLDRCYTRRRLVLP